MASIAITQTDSGFDDGSSETIDNINGSCSEYVCLVQGQRYAFSAGELKVIKNDTSRPWSLNNYRVSKEDDGSMRITKINTAIPCLSIRFTVRQYENVFILLRDYSTWEPPQRRARYTVTRDDTRYTLHSDPSNSHGFHFHLNIIEASAAFDVGIFLAELEAKEHWQSVRRQQSEFDRYDLGTTEEEEAEHWRMVERLQAVFDMADLSTM